MTDFTTINELATDKSTESQSNLEMTSFTSDGKDISHYPTVNYNSFTDFTIEVPSEKNNESIDLVDIINQSPTSPEYNMTNKPQHTVTSIFELETTPANQNDNFYDSSTVHRSLINENISPTTTPYVEINDYHTSIESDVLLQSSSTIHVESTVKPYTKKTIEANNTSSAPIENKNTKTPENQRKLNSNYTGITLVENSIKIATLPSRTQSDSSNSSIESNTLSSHLIGTGDSVIKNSIIDFTQEIYSYDKHVNEMKVTIAEEISTTDIDWTSKVQTSSEDTDYLELSTLPTFTNPKSKSTIIMRDTTKDYSSTVSTDHHTLTVDSTTAQNLQREKENTYLGIERMETTTQLSDQSTTSIGPITLNSLMTNKPEFEMSTSIPQSSEQLSDTSIDLHSTTENTVEIGTKVTKSTDNVEHSASTILNGNNFDPSDITTPALYSTGSIKSSLDFTTSIHTNIETKDTTMLMVKNAVSTLKNLDFESTTEINVESFLSTTPKINTQSTSNINVDSSAKSIFVSESTITDKPNKIHPILSSKTTTVESLSTNSANGITDGSFTTVYPSLYIHYTELPEEYKTKFTRIETSTNSVKDFLPFSSTELENVEEFTTNPISDVYTKESQSITFNNFGSSVTVEEITDYTVKPDPKETTVSDMIQEFSETILITQSTVDKISNTVTEKFSPSEHHKTINDNINGVHVIPETSTGSNDINELEAHTIPINNLATDTVLPFTNSMSPINVNDVNIPTQITNTISGMESTVLITKQGFQESTLLDANLLSRNKDLITDMVTESTTVDYVDGKKSTTPNELNMPELQSTHNLNESLPISSHLTTKLSTAEIDTNTVTIPESEIIKTITVDNIVNNVMDDSPNSLNSNEDVDDIVKGTTIAVTQNMNEISRTSSNDHSISIDITEIFDQTTEPLKTDKITILPKVVDTSTDGLENGRIVTGLYEQSKTKVFLETSTSSSITEGFHNTETNLHANVIAEFTRKPETNVEEGTTDQFTIGDVETTSTTLSHLHKETETDHLTSTEVVTEVYDKTETSLDTLDLPTKLVTQNVDNMEITSPFNNLLHETDSTQKIGIILQNENKIEKSITTDNLVFSDTVTEVPYVKETQITLNTLDQTETMPRSEITTEPVSSNTNPSDITTAYLSDISYSGGEINYFVSQDIKTEEAITTDYPITSSLHTTYFGNQMETISQVKDTNTGKNKNKSKTGTTAHNLVLGLDITEIYDYSTISLDTNTKSTIPSEIEHGTDPNHLKLSSDFSESITTKVTINPTENSFSTTDFISSVDLSDTSNLTEIMSNINTTIKSIATHANDIETTTVIKHMEEIAITGNTKYENNVESTSFKPDITKMFDSTANELTTQSTVESDNTEANTHSTFDTKLLTITENYSKLEKTNNLMTDNIHKVGKYTTTDNIISLNTLNPTSETTRIIENINELSSATTAEQVTLVDTTTIFAPSNSISTNKTSTLTTQKLNEVDVLYTMTDTTTSNSLKFETEVSNPFEENKTPPTILTTENVHKVNDFTSGIEFTHSDTGSTESTTHYEYYPSNMKFTGQTFITSNSTQLNNFNQTIVETAELTNLNKKDVIKTNSINYSLTTTVKEDSSTPTFSDSKKTLSFDYTETSTVTTTYAESTSFTNWDESTTTPKSETKVSDGEILTTGIYSSDSGKTKISSKSRHTSTSLSTSTESITSRQKVVDISAWPDMTDTDMTSTEATVPNYNFHNNIHCKINPHCPTNKACLNGVCQNPCHMVRCTKNESCIVKDHGAVCLCDDSAGDKCLHKGRH